MAFFAVAGRSSSFCLLLLLACSILQAQARESQFFSKATRYVGTTTTKTIPGEEEQLLPAKKEEPVKYTTDTGNGYGLYGRGPEKLPPATTVNPSATTYTNAGENFNTENVPSEFPNKEFDGDVNFGNKEFNTEKFPNNEFPSAVNFGNKEFNGAGGYPTGGSYNKEANARYPSYANEHEQYGMSDTRFFENGKYFYDLNAEESYRNAAYNPARGNPQAYGSFGEATERETFGNRGYGYGNSNRGNNFEENTSMEGYQTNTKENQEEYAP